MIGETERAAAAKAGASPLEPISTEQWVQKYIAPAGERAVAGTHAYMALIQHLGGEVAVTPPRQGSIYAAFKGADVKTFYPFHLWGEAQMVSLSFQYLHQRPGLRGEAVRQQLLDRLVQIVGPMKTTTKTLTGFPSFKVALLAEPDVAARVESWLSAALVQMR